MKLWHPVMGVGRILAVLVSWAGPGWADEATERLREAEAEIRQLQGRCDELQKLALELLTHAQLNEVALPDGRSFEGVEILQLEAGSIRFRHRTAAGGHATEEIALDEAPPALRRLLARGESAPSQPVKPAKPARKVVPGSTPGRDVARAIVVIEGDLGVGTGFVVRENGRNYLYTAAHVLSGNRRLRVKLSDGRTISSFGDFEAAEGADLVRIVIDEEVDHALGRASTAGRARDGLKVFAAGNADGRGTVGFEPGRVQGVGAESIEIDADVVQGNSGGPILDGDTHEALGVVTHLVAARKDQWARETRFSEIRRFGCRLDREWKWRKLPIGRFLTEGRKVREVTELNELFLIAMTPSEWSSGSLRRFDEGNVVVKEIRALSDWIDERQSTTTRLSEADQKRRIARMFDILRSTSKQQVRKLRPEGYVWFHREMASEALKFREELDAGFLEALDDLR